MDTLARLGKTGQAMTIPEGMSTGSDVAALTILGYDTRNLYTGRSPLEAASIGIQLQPTDVAFLCNLVVLGEADGQRTMADFSGGHITPRRHVSSSTPQRRAGQRPFNSTPASATAVSGLA
jgi:2,3-bisphosphoglycerate-independent phosphoglycerate mutase